jgi:hypothetical protein
MDHVPLGHFLAIPAGSTTSIFWWLALILSFNGSISGCISWGYDLGPWMDGKSFELKWANDGLFVFWEESLLTLVRGGGKDGMLQRWITLMNNDASRSFGQGPCWLLAR